MPTLVSKDNGRMGLLFVHKFCSSLNKFFIIEDFYSGSTLSVRYEFYVFSR